MVKKRKRRCMVREKKYLESVICIDHLNDRWVGQVQSRKVPTKDYPSIFSPWEYNRPVGSRYSRLEKK
jgi:hypothetical protein